MQTIYLTTEDLREFVGRMITGKWWFNAIYMTKRGKWAVEISNGFFLQEDVFRGLNVEVPVDE